MQPPTVKICAAAIALSGLIWGAASASGATPNANIIACPSAPAGWTNPPGEGGRLVQSPDPSDASASGLDLGTDIVRITCSYFKDDNRMTVAVSYALPIDFNPWWDFDFGCTSVNHTPGFLPVTGFPWDSQHRLYFTIDSKSWSYAMFQDPYDLLSSGDVSPFEHVAQSLLANAQPAAHNCTLPGGGGPAITQSTWAFWFTFTATNNNVTTTGSSKGSFFTSPSSSGSTGVIGGLHANNIALTVTAKGSKPQQVSIHVGAPISFRSFYSNTLKAAIAVLDSNDPSCPVGSTGTLTVSTPSSVTLDICGGRLLQGSQIASTHIEST
ncbi:MAG TPA: hypothetical protein VG652_03030 [Gaiellaceae bacterium]|nr:hypothetical protein [Gaiellaceae bacterium]